MNQKTTILIVSGDVKCRKPDKKFMSSHLKK